MLIVDVVGSSN